LKEWTNDQLGGRNYNCQRVGLPLLPSYKWIIVVDGAIPSKKYSG